MSVSIPTLSILELRIAPEFDRLYELAYNLWWSWNADANDLWRQIDADLWSQYRNPVEVLAACDESVWRRLEHSESFIDTYSRAVSAFDTYMAPKETWWDRHGRSGGPVAYLCAEFGVHPSLPIYSGGLGVLAGDHAKAASDLGVPFVGVGLFYRRGYFRQTVDAVGAQQHNYPTLDPSRIPIQPVASTTGGQLRVPIEFPGRTVWAAVWRYQIGRVPILLLDTDIPENDPADRPITHTLYVRGREMRFCQELVLGIGGVRTLQALKINPAVWHVNEGHAAMSALERLSNEVEAGTTLEEATQKVSSNTLFTLHTPVPAGNERFAFNLAEKYLGWWPASAGTDMAYLNQIGTAREGDQAFFDLGALAIRHAAVVNGVSKRHGEVVNGSWSHLLSSPALGITNGVHTPTWASRGLGRMVRQAVGDRWPNLLVEDTELVERIRQIDDEEIWNAHLRQKRIFAGFVRGRLRRQFARHGASPDDLRAVENMVHPEWLTIGFARRFATYKRATLLFHNVPWLQAILTNPDRPVQIVFAGKAHPADEHGQGLIRRIVELSRTPELRGHIFLLEDYDMRMGRFLVQGTDVWLNNPRPPQEASGTSGMKAALNGVLNLSILDGWWMEGYNEKNGFAFGLDWDTGDHGHQDNEDAVALYRMLQDRVVPLYYERDEDDIPREWVAMMKEASATAAHQFSTHRMVRDYAREAYIPLGS